MIEYLILVSLVVLASLIYQKVLLPRRIQAWYKKTLEDLGYKVLNIPFKPFRDPFKDRAIECTQAKSDTFWEEKHLYPNFDVVVTNVSDVVCLILINPDLISELLTPDKVALHHKMKYFIRGSLTLINGGVAFAEDEKWKKTRKSLSVITFEFLKNKTQSITSIVDSFLDNAQHEHSEKDEFEIDIIELAGGIFCSIIINIFVNQQIPPQEQINGEKVGNFFTKLFQQQYILYDPLISIFGDLHLTLGIKSSFRHYNKKARLFQEYCRCLVERRMESLRVEKKPNSYSDILQALYWEHEGDSVENRLDEKQLTKELETFIITGMDASACTFGQIINFLSENAEVEAKLRKEIEVVFKDKPITYDDLKGLEYMDAVLNETIRMAGPFLSGMIPRQATKDHYLKDIPIKRNIALTFSQYANAYSPNHFHHPFSFLPQRWQQECNNIHPYANAHFSGGPRACLGKGIFWIETKITLVKFLQRYQKFASPPGQKKQILEFMYRLQHFKTKLRRSRSQNVKKELYVQQLSLG